MQNNKQWNWMDCNLTLKRASKKNQNQVFEILQSQYIIQLQEDESETELNIEISMQKKINYQQQSGFTWHKSWNIPSIEIKISKRDLHAIKNQLGISRVYCQITSGYPVRKMVQFYIQQVCLDGQNRKQIGTNGIARFNNLKFSQTSFNHERNKFSLILIIFTKNEQKSRSVLKSYISLPIYVDSRKQARKRQPTNMFLSQMIPIQTFRQQLQLRHLDKKLLKNKQRPSKQQIALKGKYMIDYTLPGFIRYYKSANIRNKIKHPYYFVYHFSSVLTLYFNKQLAQSLVQVLKILQKPLKNQTKKYITIALKAQGNLNNQIEEMKKKTQQIFQSWKYTFIDVVIKNSPLHKNMLQQIIQLQNTQTSKWVQASRNQLQQAYNIYYQDFLNRQNSQKKSQSGSNQQQQNSKQGQKKFDHFELHQVLNIQKAFQNQHGNKKVKLQIQQQ